MSVLFHRLHARRLRVYLPGKGTGGDPAGSREGAAMSKRHRNEEIAPVPRAELRAHAHNERHRVHSELHLVEEIGRVHV